MYKSCKIALFLFLAVNAASFAFAQTQKFGAMGDSLTDEYSDQGNGGYATNWVTLLSVRHNLDFGSTGTWGEPRRNGYANNWARSGASSGDLIAESQPTGLLGQVQSNGVSLIVLEIGSDDFNPFLGSSSTNAYVQIYNGSWAASTIKNYISNNLNHIETAISNFQNTSANMVVADALDLGAVPLTSTLYSDATKRNRVTAAIQQEDDGIKRLAQKYGLPLADTLAIEKAIFGPNENPSTTLLVGNTAIKLTQSDSNPTSQPNRAAAFIQDGVHPHSNIQGLLANLFLEAMNEAYAANITLFTEREILGNSGLAYGGSDTLISQIGSYSNYIVLPIHPKITTLQFTNAAVKLNFTTVTNQTYAVETTTNLSAGWGTLTANITGTGGSIQIIDSSPKTPVRFYRVRQLP